MFRLSYYFAMVVTCSQEVRLSPVTLERFLYHTQKTFSTHAVMHRGAQLRLLP